MKRSSTSKWNLKQITKAEWRIENKRNASSIVIIVVDEAFSLGADVCSLTITITPWGLDHCYLFTALQHILFWGVKNVKLGRSLIPALLSLICVDMTICPKVFQGIFITVFFLVTIVLLVPYTSTKHTFFHCGWFIYLSNNKHYVFFFFSY